jgi:tRNA nucleotidyltransferase (CCA-adding enzyme)
VGQGDEGEETLARLGITCPEMLEGLGMAQNKWHTYDVWKHGMECLDACVGDPILRISAMLHDVGKPRSRAFSDKTHDWTFYDHDRIGAEIADPICQRLRFSNEERARIVHLVRNHLFHYTGEWTDATVRRFIQRVGKERLEDLWALNEADVRAKGPGAPDLSALAALKDHAARVLAAGDALTTRDLAIDGRDVMKELGVAPGPTVGKVLKVLLEEVVADPKKNDRDTLLAIARKLV